MGRTGVLLGREGGTGGARRKYAIALENRDKHLTPIQYTVLCAEIPLISTRIPYVQRCIGVWPLNTSKQPKLDSTIPGNPQRAAYSSKGMTKRCLFMNGKNLTHSTVAGEPQGVQPDSCNIVFCKWAHM